MVRHGLAAILIAVGGTAAAQTADCPVAQDATSCARVLACIGEEGIWFDGRAYGRGAGTLAGETNAGAVCTGTWVSRNAMGLGQADVACDDGFAVRVIYFYQDAWTGTALGRGIGSDGRLVRSWSGLHVLDYLGAGARPDGARLPCGAIDIPDS